MELYDSNFLKNLHLQNNRIIYIRITALNYQEQPLSQIQGEATGGNINIDGSSAIRRTCSISMVTDPIQINNYEWSLKNKFKLEVGLKNDINNYYSDIIWFSQGIYVINQFSYSLNVNSCVINISGKDKMCLLNGDIGGSFNTEIDFGTIEDKGEKKSLPVRDIIREAVHKYGNEPFHNIIINDIDEYGLQLEEYRYDVPLYLYRKIDSNIFENGTLNGKTPCKIISTNEETTIDNASLINYEPLIDINENNATKVYLNNNFIDQYYLTKINFGDSAGYRETELTYPGDLIGKIGDTVTSILDKIKNMLINFEYFYNLDGQFIFQKKKIHEFSNLELTGSNMITSINMNPNINNIKNDFSVWGELNSIKKDIKYPIHYRYAIDQKPQIYTSITVTEEDLQNYNMKYNINTKPQIGYTYTTEEVDWREIIYQMALDYFRFNHLDNFELKIIEANKKNNLYQNGNTGYEQYYTDLLGFWRDLYHPKFAPSGTGILGKDILGNFFLGMSEQTKQTIYSEEKNENNFYPQGHKHQYWAKKIFENPESLIFWFDFLDTDSEINKYSNKAIGNRAKSDNNDKVKTIFNRRIPNIIFYNNDSNKGHSTGHIYFNINNYDNLFAISPLELSAQEEITNMLDIYTYYNESINITTVPFYNLEPNTYLYINDIYSGIAGEYIINKISFSLAYNGTSNLTLTRKIKKLEE